MFGSFKIILNHFKIKNIFNYIKYFRWYYSRFKFVNRIKALQKDWLTNYGVTCIENLTFIFSINDYTIPNDMLKEKKVYSQDDMIFFIEMAKKHYGITNDTKKYFFDIGANIGTTSIYIEKYLLKNAQIIAFEPMNENNLLLEVNKTINKCKRIKNEKIALSNHSSKNRFIYDSESPGESRVILKEEDTKEFNSKRFHIEEINSITLDDYIDKNNIKPEEIGFLWVDVEGFEPFVLEGAGKLFENKIPLYMEFSPNKLKNNNGFDILYKILSSTYTHICSLKEGEFKIDYLKELYQKYKNIDTHFDFFFY